MKKVLLGLVIAVMMTGSGYANLDNDKCSYLNKRAKDYINVANSHNDWAKEAINDNDLYGTFSDEEMKAIKKAHYFAVTWSALCD